MRVIRKYTLTELLVVMAIIGVLLSISMPAFEKLVKGNNVTAATNSLSTALSQARSLAVLQRKYVALLLPTVNLPAKYLYKSYRLCYVKKDASGNYGFDGWTDDGIWHFLPTGVILAEIDNTSGWNSGTFSTDQDVLTTIGNSSATKVDCSDIGSSYNSITVSGIVFSPYGSASKDIYIAITEGINDGGIITYTSKDGSGNPANKVEIGIARFTGRNTIL